MRFIFAMTMVISSMTFAFAESPKANPSVKSEKMNGEQAARLDELLMKMQAFHNKLAPLEAEAAEILARNKLTTTTEHGSVFSYDLMDMVAYVGKDKISFARDTYGIIIRGAAPLSAPTPTAAIPTPKPASPAPTSTSTSHTSTSNLPLSTTSTLPSSTSTSTSPTSTSTLPTKVSRVP
jgi:hypothetical protein